MKSLIKSVAKVVFFPVYGVLYLFEDDHAPTHKAFRQSIMAYEKGRQNNA